MFFKSKMYRNLLSFIFVLLIIVGFSTISVNASTENNGEVLVCDATLADDFLDDSIIVVLKNDFSLISKTYLCNDFNEINCINVEDLTENSIDILQKQIIAEQTGDWSLLSKHKENNMLIDVDSFNRILCLTIGNPGKENVLTAIKELEKRNDVYSVEPNYIESLDLSTDDTYFLSDQWGLNQTYGINVSKAWDYTTGNSNILVGVIDSGIDAKHPDLINTVNDNLHRDYVDTPFLSNVREVDKADLEDLNGHGTHVAGIIGAQGNNITGISGVVQNISLVSLRVFDSNGDGDASDVKRAIDFATKEAIPILNYSGGGTNNHSGRRKAIENYPGLFVCSAGNDGQDNDLNDHYPSNYNFDNLISVGAINSNGQRRSTSNFGANNVDIFAPGQSILSTYPTALYDTSSSSHKAVGYRFLSGTSMAAPFVTGVAALMLSANPNITSQQIKFTIMNNATKYSALDNLCVSEGRLDAFKSVSAAVFNTSTVNDDIKINGFVSGYSMIDYTNLEIPESFAQISSEYGTPIQEIAIIGTSAFKDMGNLKSIIIPNTVTHVDSSAFENCSYLQSVTLPANLVAIGSSAFKGCGSLATITIPNGVTHIDSSAFENCSYLQSVTLPSSLIVIGSSAFKGCGSLVNITIPNSVTNIDSSAFENCSYLQTIILSSNLNAIGVSAFKGCGSLGSITIPSSVQYIDDSAFENCVSLVSVIVEREISNITNLGNYAFAGCSSALQIIVPKNRLAEYKNKVYWSSYKSKIVSDNILEELELNCYSNFYNQILIESKYNKLYELNINCAKNYKITSTANSTVEMKIYDSNMDLVTSGNDLISHYLGKGVYYLDLRFADDEDSGAITTSFELTWPVSKYDITMGNTNILTHLHETSSGNFINKLYLQNVNGEGFYKFTITGYDKNNNLITLPANAIKIYRSGTTDEIINCYSMIDNTVYAENSENMNSLIVYLYDYLGFYIDICLPTNEYNSLTLNIQKVAENNVDLFDLSESQDQNILSLSGLSLGDNIQKITLKQAGRFELNTNGFTQGQFVVLKVRAIVDDTMVFAEPILYDLSLNNQYEFDLLEGTYYVGYIGTNLNVNLSCALTRKVTIYGDSYLNPDPNFVGVNGSEVTLNGGYQYSNEITQGFTRVIYLTTGESRLDYYWYSSYEDVARITDFGTVVGLNVNTDTVVKIMAVNIEDPSKVFVKEFIIKKDTKTFNSDPIIRYGNIEIDTNISNETQIDLSDMNVPINWLQYFTWSSSDSDLYVDQFGRIFADEETIGNIYTITGTYKLNSRVKVYITVVVK